MCDSVSSHATHHIDPVLVHEDTDTEQKGEEQLVPLKQGAADIAVQTEGEVVIDAAYTLRQNICRKERERSYKLQVLNSN